MRVSHDGGLTWDPGILTPASGPGRQWDPQLIVDRNDIIHLVYNTILVGTDSTIHIGHSDDAGITWKNSGGSAGFLQVTPVLDNQLLSKAAYDYGHDIVWNFWKHSILSNTVENIVGTHMLRRGNYIASPNEYVTDLDTNSTGFHNFVVGADGLVRATYNVGDGDPVTHATMLYRERLSLPPALAPELKNARVEAGEFKFDWESEFAVQYTVQYTTDYATWTDVVPTVVGEGATVTYSLPRTGTWRVIRVGAER
jgi:hypothetical protein